MKRVFRKRYIVGIDEAGRGPLAGPVAVGVVAVPYDFEREWFDNIRDSKQLSTRDREKWRARADVHPEIRYAVSLVGPATIDRRGIVAAIRMGMARALSRLSLDPARCDVLLDGTLRAPRRFTRQTTIVRGDETEPVISLAGICAKVVRDRHMERLARKYPIYRFDQHKGYGTKTHKRMIGLYGLSGIHRKSFIKI